MKKISRKTAERRFNSGSLIFIYPSKVNPLNPIGQLFGGSYEIDPIDNDAIGFAVLCQNVKNYNCCRELGFGLSFYMPD